MITTSIIERVLDLAIQIQQISAPTFFEQQRAKFIQGYFSRWGMNNVSMDEVGNVYSHIRGRGTQPAIVVSAHLDTVFPPDTNLSISRDAEKIIGPGIGDNALGLAGLFGLYWSLSELYRDFTTIPSLDGDLWLVANVGEEGLGNLKGMKSVIDRLGDSAQAYIVIEGMSLKHIYHRGLGVRRYRISIQTRGGHSWLDYGKPSAIHELADLVVKLKNLPLPVDPRTSLNVGIISGGTSVNTIAPEAHCELDLRSENPQTLEALIDQVEAIVEKADQHGGEMIGVSFEVIGNRPAGKIPADHPLVKLALDSYTRNGIDAELNIGSTDANEPLYRGLPSICVGLTTGGGAHTIGEYIDTQPLQLGLSSLVDLIRALFEKRNRNTS